MKIIRIIAGIVAGEVALVLLTTLAQEVLFDGISYLGSSTITLIAGGALTIVAAIGAGTIARVVGRKEYIVIPSVISVLIIMEMSYLIGAGITTDPVWFDALAGLSLVLGIWFGYFIFNLLPGLNPFINYNLK